MRQIHVNFWLLMLALMVAALSLTACGGSDSDDDDNVTGNTVSINLERAGTLSNKLSKTQASELLKLKLSGHMDARDFDFLKWDCIKIQQIDLSDVVIDSYSGVEGTEEGNNKTYAANEIPSGAFFYWNDVHKYVYDGMPKDEGMPSLRKIVLPTGIKAIRRNAFARAYNLTEINIPEGVEQIDYVAFAICTSLRELTLPSTLKTIGQQAFASMDNLESMTILASTPPSANSNSFQGMENRATLYVPKGTKALYSSSAGWKGFKKIVEIGGGNNDEGGSSSTGSAFSVTVDGVKNEVENVEWLNPVFGHGGYNKGNYFCLESYPLGNGQIHIIFPFSQYNSNVQPSYFSVGYSDFGADATDIEYITASMSGWHGDYTSGSARVTKNDGKYITIQFSSYSFEVKRSDRTHSFVLDGALTFMAYLYN